MGDEVYSELPQDEAQDIYQDLEMGQPDGPPPPPVPTANRPLPSAPSLPERNPQTPQRVPVPSLPPKSTKSTFYDQTAPSPAKRPAPALPPLPSHSAPKGDEQLRVSQAFQIFIQSKKTGSTKSQYSTPWAKRPDTSGQEMEFISLQGNDSNIPFVPPSILVKMPQATEVATGNYLRLFIPPASSSQQPPAKATAGLELPNSTAAADNDQDMVYDDTVSSTQPQDTYDDVVQRPANGPDETYDDVVTSKAPEETYDDVTLKQDDTYDDVIQKPQTRESVTDELVYDDVEMSRGSNRNSPTPSASSEASSNKKSDKKLQKTENQRIKKREKSIKHFKQFGLKMTDPYIQDLVAIAPSEKSKDKDVLQIAQGERLQLILKEHAKLKEGMWLVEKSDGSIGMAQAKTFSEGDGEIYDTC